MYVTCEDSSSTATAAAAGTANVRAGLSDHTTDSRVKIPSLFALTSPPDLTCDHRLATCMPLAIWTYELNSGVNLQQITRERLSIMRFSLSAVGVHSIIAPRFPPTKGTPLPLPSLTSASDPLFPHTHTDTGTHAAHVETRGRRRATAVLLADSSCTTQLVSQFL